MLYKLSYERIQKLILQNHIFKDSNIEKLLEYNVHLYMKHFTSIIQIIQSSCYEKVLQRKGLTYFQVYRCSSIRDIFSGREDRRREATAPRILRQRREKIAGWQGGSKDR